MGATVATNPITNGHRQQKQHCFLFHKEQKETPPQKNTGDTVLGTVLGWGKRIWLTSTQESQRSQELPLCRDFGW
jgi:hypothetical protein